MKKMLVNILLLVAMLAVPCAATNYYVVGPGQSVPNPPWTNWAWAHTNLIEVVARCRDGDTVYVTNHATYYLTNQVEINYAVEVRSWAPGGGLDPDTTILNGNYPDTTNRIFYLKNYGACIRGLTLTNGCWWSTSGGTPWSGGGAVHITKGHLTNCILAGNRNHHNVDGSVNGGGALFLGGGTGNSGTVYNCKFIGNISTNNSGGGVKVSFAGPWVVANCEFTCNQTTNANKAVGGALSAYEPVDLELRDCQIISNYSKSYGGGVAFIGGGRMIRCWIQGNKSMEESGGGAYLRDASLIRDCLIYDNEAAVKGGGLFFSLSAGGSAQNCTFFNNRADEGGGIYFEAATNWLENCIFWGNEGGASSNYLLHASAICFMTNCCTAPDPAAYGTNCVAIDCIVKPPQFAGAAAGDLHLRPDSPCVNAGVNREAAELDLDGLSRIDRFMRQVDMGAFEYHHGGMMFNIR